MKLFGDLKILYHMALKPVRGKDHAARLESFYSGQADNYDDFRNPPATSKSSGDW